MIADTETGSPPTVHRSYRLPFILYLFALVTLIASASYVALSSYRQATETASNRSAARADLAAELVANSLLSTRYGLQTLAGFIQPMLPQAGILPGTRLESVEQLLNQRLSRLAFVDELFVVDLAGNVIHSSANRNSEKMPGWSFIQRHLATSSADDLVTPLYTDPDTGELWIWRVRKLRSGTGDIVGVIAARQSPEAIAGSMAELSLSAGQSIAIIEQSMRLVTRLPALPDGRLRPGTVIDESYTRRFVDSASESRQAVVKSPIDGERRFYAFQRVPDAPYVVVVGETTSVALRGWQDSLWASGVGILLVGVIGLFFLRQFYRRVSVEQELLRENAERRHLQHTAQSNEARLQALVDSIPDLIFVFDPQGRFTFVHAADDSELILPPDQLLGMHYREVLPEELSSQFDRIRLEPRKPGQTFDLDYQLFFEGEARDFEARVSVLSDWEGQYGGSLVLVRNVTESKIYEAELRIASTAFETHLGIMITDDHGVILRANKAFSRITGYAEHEVVGKTPRILQSGLQDGAFYNHLWARVREAGSWEGEIWNRRKNGEVYAEWLTITAICGESGVVQNFVGTFHDITKRKEAEREAHRLAFYDSLTGLANKALLEERLSEVCKANTRQGTHAALLYLDIEQFRAVNDARGYGVGDLVLKSLAERLTSVVRESDTLARVGGDEFAVLLVNLHSSEDVAARSAESVAEKILEVFSRAVDVLDHRIQVAVNVGITLIDGRNTQYDQQLQRAEQATQQAKDRGKVRGEKGIAFFNPEIQEKVVEHVLLEEELRNARAEQQLVLYYQPQIRNPNQLIGYEVLLRWQHPERGMVSPGVFIPIAEQSRLILPIGRWVLEQACEKLSAWRGDPARAGVSLAVNVSIVQFQSDGFIEHLRQVLERTAAPPHLLKLEVTESLLMDDPERITQIMNRLRAMEVRFSLDDFGTGYSSMSYLKRLPLDQIKIDQSFVQEVNGSAASSAIVESIIGLARGLGLEVIAEGVETDAQRDWLVGHGCELFQGFLFGRPGEET